MAAPGGEQRGRKKEDIFLLEREGGGEMSSRQSRGFCWCLMRQLGRLIEAGERRVSDSDAIRSIYISPSTGMSCTFPHISRFYIHLYILSNSFP